MAIIPTFFTGGEHGVATINTNGNGLANTVGAAGANPITQTSVVASGTYAFRHNVPSVAGTCYIRKTIFASGDNIVWGSFKIRIATEPASGTVMIAAIGVGAGVVGQIRWNTSTDALGCFFSGGTSDESATSMSLNTWYRVAWKLDVSTGTSQLDLSIYDNTGTLVDTCTATISQSATFATYFQWGWSASEVADIYYDDIICCKSGDAHPIGNVEIVALKPNADVSHNNDTGVMQDQSGNVIDNNIHFAYDELNSLPPDSTTYIRQTLTGTDKYVGIAFEDLSVSHSAVVGAHAILAYTSDTTTSNRGGCIVTKDDYTTSSTLWGSPGATADYSDGSLSNLFYKSALVDGVNDDTTVNALRARLGYSGDATPDPYWIDLIIEVAYVPATGTQYNQSASGGITPAGVVAKQANKTFTGGLVPSGGIAKLAAKIFAGTLTSTGAVLKRTEKLLSGNISSIVGTLNTARIRVKELAGTLTSLGSLTKQGQKNLTGSNTPAGTLSKSVTKSFTGSITPSGTAIKQTSKIFSGGLSPSGALTIAAQFLKSLAGSLTPSGTIAKQAQKFFSGGITPTGVLSSAATFVKNLVGSITPVGTVAKQALKSLSGNITPTGALILVRTFLRELTGSITPSGDLVKQTSKIFSGEIAPSGNLFKTIGKILSGILTSAGDLVGDFIQGGGNSFFKTLEGTLSSSGLLEKLTGKSLEGETTPDGTVNKSTAKSFEGELTPDGQPSKTTSKTFGGTVTSSGSLSAVSIFIKVLEGTIAFAGNVSKAISKTLAGSNAPSGSLNKTTAKTFSGTLPSSGSLSFASVFLKALGGVMTFAGSITKATRKTLTGDVSPAGSLNKFTSVFKAGQVGFQGGITKEIRKFFSGILDFIGNLVTVSGIFNVEVPRVYLLGSKIHTVEMSGEADLTISFEGTRDFTITLKGDKRPYNHEIQ